MKKRVYILLIIFLLPLVLGKEKIWVVGDSLSINDSYEGYPPQLDKLMKTNSSNYNLAISGVKCDYVIEYEIPKITQGDYAIVLCGTNDIYQGENSSQVLEDFEKIYSLLTKKNITSIFLTISPNEPFENCNKILEVNQGLKNFTLNKNITLIDTYSALTNGTPCYPNRSLYQDYVHLNKKGNFLVARLIWEEGFNKTVHLSGFSKYKSNILKKIIRLFGFYFIKNNEHKKNQTADYPV